MSGRKVGSRLLPFVISLACALPVLAGERVHTVRPGESASSVAGQYYGDAELGDLLLRYNDKPDPLIRPGESLKVPFCETHRVRAGDTWSGLAKRHLGRAAASSVLAELNGLVPEAPLRVGQNVLLPVVVRHTLARGESLASLSERYYGDARRSRILREFGRIEDTRRLAVGTVVEIPLTSLRLNSVERAEPAPPPEETSRFAEPIAESERLFAEGEYDGARARLEALRESVETTGTDADRRAFARLLASVYVAFALDDEACEAYRAVPPAERDGDLDPDLVSPRIREALSKCPPERPAAAGLDASGPSPQI